MLPEEKLNSIVQVLLVQEVVGSSRIVANAFVETTESVAGSNFDGS